VLSSALDDGQFIASQHTYRPPNPFNTDGTPDDWLNVALVDTGNLPAGTHTLEIKLNESIGQPFIVDYILYQPSFTSLSAMLDLSSLTPQPRGPEESGSPAPAPSNPSISSTKPKIGVIVGSTVAVLIVVSTTLALIVFYLRKRRKRELRLDPERKLRCLI
jgi:hypothetical protein